MVASTKGIVLRTTDYSNTSVIASIYTEQFGLQSYIIGSVRSGGGNDNRGKIAHFQPLSLVDLVVYHKDKGGVMRIKEVSCPHPYLELDKIPVKMMIGQFLGEIVSKLIREPDPYPELFQFLYNSFRLLDLHEHPEDFHLLFLVRLSSLLGIGITKEELFKVSGDKIDPILLDTLLGAEYRNGLDVTRLQRKLILQILLDFYRMHAGLGEVKSIRVFEEVFS